MGAEDNDRGPTQVQSEQWMTPVSGSTGRKAPAATDSDITYIIAVASGIRGVGKSSVAALLAVGLHRHRLKVGLFDADSMGASLLRMFSIHQRRAVNRSEEIAHVVSRDGIKLVTLNRLSPGDEQPIAIEHAWEELAGGHLDYLIVNLPPGTSGASPIVTQALPVDGVVLVTSPRDMAEMALREVANMFKHSGIPLIGLVDNMRHVVCPACGTDVYVFGTGQAEFSAQLFKTELLGRLPLDPELACLCDAGEIENYRRAELDSITERVLQFAAKPVSKTSGQRQSADKRRG